GPGTVYTVTSNPGVITTETEGINGAIVSGLTNGTSYTFTVTGTTANGTSEASNVSNAVTPTAGATTLTVPAPTTTPAATTAPVVVADASAIIPVGAPDTGAGGTSGATDGPLVGLGGLTLILAGAGATQVIRRRRQA
ncbi:MAG TPA: fibronectin type III domain-containing protein, partial [Dermatophilaceae bacterium]